MEPPKQIIINIQGNIGAGKTKILEILKSVKDYVVCDEPVDMWKDIGILKEFYQDPKKRAYLFQSVAFITRLEKYVDVLLNNNKNIIIFERNIMADKYCFAQNAYDCGFMDSFEWKTYNIIFNKWINMVSQIKEKLNINKEINITVFVQCDPEKCMNRIKSRNRSGENGTITLDYLKKLDSIHKKWIDELSLQGQKVYILDTNTDWNGKKEDEYIECIKKFFDDIINKTF